MFGALERNGEFHAYHTCSLNGVKDAAKEGSIAISDEFAGYSGPRTNHYAET